MVLGVVPDALAEVREGGDERVLRLGTGKYAVRRLEHVEALKRLGEREGGRGRAKL